jgi:hypothetical protein
MLMATNLPVAPAAVLVPEGCGEKDRALEQALRTITAGKTRLRLEKAINRPSFERKPA